MAPSAKSSGSSKPTKPSGNLRTFFTPAGSQSKLVAKSSQSSVPSQRQPTASSSKDEPTKAAEKSLKKETIVIADSDDEPFIPVAKKKPAPKDNDDSPKASSKSTLKRKQTHTIMSSDDEEEPSPPKKKAAIASSKSTPKAQPKKKRRVDDDYDMESDEDSDDFVVDEDEEEEVKPKKPTPVKPKQEKAKPKAKDSAPAKKEGQTQSAPKKFDWAAKKAAQIAGPAAHGTKEIPDGAPDALAGLAFVFTGELTAFSREEAVDLAKRFGGRVVLQPSSKTDYVVLGDNAGPSKLAAIAKHKLTTLNEDQFLELIATRKGQGKLDEKTKKKMEKEQQEIKKAAVEMETREKSTAKSVDPTNQLWTVRYAPQNLKEVCGNKAAVEKLLQWLEDWSASVKCNFTKPGKNAMNTYRAVLITGPPGIGKTTSAHLCAKLAGFTPIELNASDARSKKLVENGMNVNNTSLDGYVKGGTSNDLGVAITDRTCLIMDEVDGMSAGDRGGVGALNTMIKKSKVPIICIANDRQAQKLKPLMSTTFSMSFQRPQPQTVRSRILTIAYKEKMKIPANVIDQLVTGAQSDIRQVLNMLSTWKLSSDSMDFDEGKNLSKLNEKHTILSPFDITSRILGPYVFSPTSRETLGDKMEYYFQDHSFVPLFIQENYLRSQPAKVRNLEGPEKVLRELQLMDRAASSISDGDLVDALIHGPEQHWGLMPLHAVCSTVRPASCMYGSGVHYGGPNSMAFPQWLGQNSKQNKLSRALADVQIRMRLKVSGDKSEIRQSYIPALHPHIVKPLADEGTGAVEDIIAKMDDYYLSKEDWDTIVELGVGDNKDDIVLKKIPGATKTALTRRYNASEHPIAFHKASDLGKAPKKLAGGGVPDLEEAYVDDDIEESDSDTKAKNPDDIALDSLIKAPKKKKAVAAAGSKGKGKAKS